MKLSLKDKYFLDILTALTQEGALWVELKTTPFPRMVLRGNYGAHIEAHFGLTRQGVRWRFQRLLNDIYVSAYETILAVEQTLGPNLRSHALHIAKHRWELRNVAPRGRP